MSTPTMGIGSTGKRGSVPGEEGRPSSILQMEQKRNIATAGGSSSIGPTEVINARRTESSDAPSIHELIGQRTTSQFGHVDVVHLIEKSNLSVTLNNEDNEILGFAGFLDQPPNEVCDPASWESWLSDMKYDVAGTATPLNSLFMHFFVAKDDYTIGCASEIIRTVFNAVPELCYLFICLRNDVQLEQALARIFTPIEKKAVAGSHHKLYVCHRHDHVPQLHIRRAVVEDHDDVIPIFKRLKNNLTEVYGNYFLAEMVEAQDENNFCLVAEANGKAIGFMSVCAEVNVPFLQKSFELGSFHGFSKPHPDDVLEETESKRGEYVTKVDEQTVTEEVEEPDDQTFLPETEPAAPIVFRDQLMDDSSTTNEGSTEEEEAQDDLGLFLPSEESLTGIPSGRTDTSPKLSEQHMGSLSGSESQEDTHVSSIDVCLAVPPFVASPKKKFMPTYCGESNVFSIQLFCISEQYEMRSVDFLPEVFKFIPNKDIAIMTIPHLVPEFPLLQQFVRVTPKPGTNVPHELYAFHRHGLLSSRFVVRKACSSDYKQVEALINNVEMKENLLDDLKLFNSARRDQDGTAIQAFVADCEDQVVGICIIRNEESIEYIRSHYNVEDFIYFNHHRRDEHGHLHHFAMNPIFQHNSKHFMKEVLRQSHKSCLYYSVYPKGSDDSLTKQQSLITGLNFLVPVRARKQIDYSLEELGVNAPADRVVVKCPPYALTHINRKLTLEPKVTINARIVVVGASDVGMSILENLCFCPHLRFNNLTLVSKRGLPSSLRSSAFAFMADEMSLLSLRSWVNVVKGIMIAIDRSHQELIMEDGSRVPYDHLVLCTGQQFQVPAPTDADVDNVAVNNDLSVSELIRPYDIRMTVPENVLALNDVDDYETVDLWASRIAGKITTTGENQPCIVVYGRSLETFMVIQRLLSCGIPGERLVIAKPPSHITSLSVCDDGCEGDPFNEPVVADEIMSCLKKSGVKILSDHVLANWSLQQSGSGMKVVSLSFTTSSKPLIDFPCLGFLSLHPRRIDHRTFLAANDSCLVFDGRLSIDANFKTNDPRIRAAGPLTKYTRRYYADSVDYRHENFNSREIGFRLAMSILPLFDPTLDGNVEMSNAIPPTPGPASRRATPAALSHEENPHDKLVPVYVEPKVTYGTLPGDYEYLHVRKPGRKVKYDVQLSDGDHGRELTTGKVKRGNYFRLHINQYGCVETITCLAKPEVVQVPVSNILRLYGIHERYLNNLVSRYDEGLICDFFVFFREPWATAIFHDRFQDFRQEVRDILSSAPAGAKNVLSVEGFARGMADEDMAINEEQKRTLVDHYDKTGRRVIVEGRLLSYLSYNYYHLPMYAKPGMV